MSDDSETIRRCRQTHRTCRREAANGFPQSRCKSSHKEEAPRKQVESLNMSYLREIIEYKIIGTCVANYLAYFAARLSPTKWIVSFPTLADGMFHRHCLSTLRSARKKGIREQCAVFVALPWVFPRPERPTVI